MTSHNLFLMLDDAIVGIVLFFCSQLFYTKLIDILSVNTLFFLSLDILWQPILIL